MKTTINKNKTHTNFTKNKLKASLIAFILIFVLFAGAGCQNNSNQTASISKNKTSTSSNLTNKKITYYKKYPDVPDFGAIYGYSATTDVDFTGGIGYAYELSENTLDDIEEYFRILVDCGYSPNETISEQLDDDKTTWFIFEKGSLGVSIVFSSDYESYFFITVIE